MTHQTLQWGPPTATLLPTPRPLSGPLTCPQEQLLLPGFPSQGLRQLAAAQEGSDADWSVADMLAPLLT